MDSKTRRIRDEKIYEASRGGGSPVEIGKKYGLSPERIRQILRRMEFEAGVFREKLQEKMESPGS